MHNLLRRELQDIYKIEFEREDGEFDVELIDANGAVVEPQRFLTITRTA